MAQISPSGNTGTITVNNQDTNSEIFDNANGGVIQINGGAALTNTGTLRNQLNAILKNDGTLNNDGILTNSGTLESQGILNNNSTLTNSRTLTINNNGVFANNGSLVNDLNLNNFGAFSISSKGTLTNKGTFTNDKILTNDGTLTNGGTFTNRGTFTNGNGGILNLDRTSMFNSGPTNFINKGTLAGSGTFVGNLSEGTVSPGGVIADPANPLAHATLNVTGNFKLGTLKTTFLGIGSGEFDVLNVNGPVEFLSGSKLTFEFDERKLQQQILPGTMQPITFLRSAGLTGSLNLESNTPTDDGDNGSDFDFKLKQDRGNLVLEITHNVAPVAPPNTAPTVTNPIKDVTVQKDAPNTVIPLFDAFADAQTPPNGLNYTFINSNPALFTSTTLDRATGKLTLDYEPTVTGSSKFTVSATDPGGAAIKEEFDVTVAPSVPIAGTVPLGDFIKDPAKFMSSIRDYDGNDLGSGSSWKPLGSADVQKDGDVESIFVNPSIGRWATVGSTGDAVDFSKHGLGGDTRVVGIYIDPTLKAKPENIGGPFDSQRRFQNDLRIDNLKVLAADDYDKDGLQDLYFKVSDGSSVLRALMHADGNIQYANYQSKADLTSFMNTNGVSSAVWESWI